MESMVTVEVMQEKEEKCAIETIEACCIESFAPKGPKLWKIFSAVIIMHEREPICCVFINGLCCIHTIHTGLVYTRQTHVAHVAMLRHACVALFLFFSVSLSSSFSVLSVFSVSSGFSS